MKTKSKGGIIDKLISNSWQQDYIWSAQKKDFIPWGSKVTYSTSIRNGSIHTITYDDSKRKGELKRTRQCDHSVIAIEGTTQSHRYYLDSTGTKYREYWCGGTLGVDPLVIPDLNSIHMEALDYFKSGCVEKHFDLAVDLIEWKQVATLLPSLSSTLKSLKKNFLKYSFDFKKDSKRALKDLSDLHLAYSFGVKPLVSDIADLITSVKALKEKVAWLRKNQGKPVKVAFSKDLSAVNRPSSVISSNSYRVEQYPVISYNCYYRAYALLVYNVEALSDLELQLRILTRNFGLDKPATWVWELVPFSFVLDWVLKVGELIENLSPSISLPYTFLDVGYTLKIRETMCREWVFKFPYKGDTHHTMGPRTRTLFHRRPGLPISFSLATGDPGANQLALAISLAIQRWK
jgi:hypothetical protein